MNFERWPLEGLKADSAADMSFLFLRVVEGEQKSSFESRITTFYAVD